MNRFPPNLFSFRQLTFSYRKYIDDLYEHFDLCEKLMDIYTFFIQTYINFHIIPILKEKSTEKKKHWTNEGYIIKIYVPLNKYWLILRSSLLLFSFYSKISGSISKSCQYFYLYLKTRKINLVNVELREVYYNFHI